MNELVKIPTIINLRELLTAVRGWFDTTPPAAPDAVAKLNAALAPFGVSVYETEVNDFGRFMGFSLQNIAGEELWGGVSYEWEFDVFNAQYTVYLDDVVGYNITYHYDGFKELRVDLVADATFANEQSGLILATIGKIIQLHSGVQS